MKQLKLSILKKNRVYFKCMHNGHEVKLLIDDASKDLELGEQELMLDDISVRTKYGTDVIYQLAGKINNPEKIITLKHKFNEWLVKDCKNLGGKWDSDQKVWVFNELVEDEVEELDYLYNSDIIAIEIKAKDDLCGQPNVAFLGYPLFKAWGRDSGAELCDEVIMTEGKIYSAGSQKNWVAKCVEGTVFRLKISKNLLEKYENDDFEVKEL